MKEKKSYYKEKILLTVQFSKEVNVKTCALAN